MRTPTAIAREAQRDREFSNVGTPATTGDHSSVSETSLTALAHARNAATAGPAAGSLDANLRAGLLPPGPTRAAGSTGARPQTGGPAARGNDRNGPAR
ncbi:hypothetical protein ACFWUU_23130 [Kribbella sp. NPDC058693]|uniref:hypothetical protein n=1 Tax=Kribbella sp. NPDC058693 TaxID=3346602 RepID=UPI003654EF69